MRFSVERLVLAAAVTLSTGSACLAQGGFNPGTVVGNVYQNPVAGYGYGFGYSGPGFDYYGYTPGYGYPVRVRHARHLKWRSSIAR